MSTFEDVGKALARHIVESDPRFPEHDKLVGITVAEFPVREWAAKVVTALTGKEVEIVPGLKVKASPTLRIQTETVGKKTRVEFTPAPKLTATKWGFFASAKLDAFVLTEEGGEFVLGGLIPDLEIKFT